MPQAVEFITATGSGTWTVPTGTTSIDKVECIGAGGGGRTGGTTNSNGGGGGGGAYSAITSVSFTAGQVFNLSVGLRGTSGNTGGDTWFGATSLASSLVGAKGGGGTTSSSGGAGGAASSGMPTSGGTRFSGGTGGAGNATVLTGGGGGGAGGPGGNGGTGGAGDATAAGADFGGGGGSGAGTSTAGVAGAQGDASSGLGGTNGTGGGAGGNGGSGAGSTPTAATGMWTATAGGGAATGGGGGGSGSTSASPGSASAYGGGGGGRGAGLGGTSDGGSGIIIITYTAPNPQPTYKSKGTLAAVDSTSLNLSAPSSVAADDCGLIVIATEQTLSGISGWTLVSTGSAVLVSGISCVAKLFQKKLSAGETSSVTVTPSASGMIFGQFFTYSDVYAAGTPYEAVSNQNVSSTGAATYPAAVTGAANETVLHVGIGCMADTGTAGTSGFTERSEGFTGAVLAGVSLDDKVVASAGTEASSADTRVWDLATGFTLALLPTTYTLPGKGPPPPPPSSPSMQALLMR